MSSVQGGLSETAHETQIRREGRRGAGGIACRACQVDQVVTTKDSSYLRRKYELKTIVRVKIVIVYINLLFTEQEKFTSVLEK